MADIAPRTPHLSSSPIMTGAAPLIMGPAA
jgi:hypothetical protein